VPRNREIVQNESDFMPAHVLYIFSISPTCGVAFRHFSAGTCFHELTSTHLALKRLIFNFWA